MKSLNPFSLLFFTPIVAVAAPQSGKQDITWENVVVVSTDSQRDEAQHLIALLRPMVPGNIVWQEETFGNVSEPEALPRHFYIDMSLYTQNRPQVYIYSQDRTTLHVEWPQQENKEHTEAFMQALQSFTRDGILQPVSPERLEVALQHHVVYRTLDWSDVQIVCSPQNWEYAEALGKTLAPYVDGKLRVRPQSQEVKAGVTLRLITLEGPTHARLRYFGDNSIILQVSDSGDIAQNMQQAFAEFLRLLQPYIKNGKIISMKDGDLWDSLRNGFHQNQVFWHNIVVCAITEEMARPYMEALRPLTSGTIRWRASRKGDLADATGLGDDYFCIYLDYVHNGGAYIRVQEGILPAIRINRNPTPQSRQTDETESQYRARWDAIEQEMFEALFQSLQKLAVDGKLKPVSVRELKATVEKNTKD